jgi:uncharacterized protein
MTDTSVEAAAVTPPPRRIATLDIVRGIAVMGILAMNIVAFAMPFQAYMNPVAYGMESGADLASWAFSFVFIDGKMRGLFSFLFGASTLLVIERAQASGLSPARVHYARMIWLLVFGLIHFYFIWFGDILTLYALTGLFLFLFRNLSVKTLVITGIAFVALQTLFFSLIGGGAVFLSYAAAQPGATPEMVEGWRSMQEGFAPLTGQQLADKLALFRGPWFGLVGHRLDGWFQPFASIIFSGCETLGYMLFGMAALKSGFFRGDWPAARYRTWALIGFGIGIPLYAALAWTLVRANFAVEMIFAISLAATTPVRPLMIVAIAALVILLTRGGGPLVARIAAAGRAAFTNYLGTSILMTTFFYGYGLGFYGTMSRIELWLVVVAMWALMLLWSKPWLDRFQYGPFEWLWRSLARWEMQPMGKTPRPRDTADYRPTP